MEEDCRVGTCSTLLAGVQLGRRVEIGQGSTLGAGSVALADTRVGRHCEWLLPGRLPGNCLITPFTMNSCPMGHASYERGAVDDGGKRYDAGGLPFAMRTERISIGVGAYFLSWRGVPLTGGCRFVAASAWGSPDCCGRCAFRQQ
ncbi:hypothetical protein N5K55_00810 [Pseudomonas aeruginosa]|nr:hypothetical protein [Pseudomonas aeruginosa]